MTAYADDYVRAMRAALVAAGDPARAGQMQAYMKSAQPFYGVQSKPCEQIYREVRAAYPLPARADYEAAVRALWAGSHREEMYQAIRTAEGSKQFYNLAGFPLYEALIYSATWWDTLDWLAGITVSNLLRRHREAIEARLLVWRSAESLWVRRAALLAHLKQKDATNVDLLAETILLLAHEQDFFIRKAIGWVLRDYSYTDPAWVAAFVAQHAAVLAPLSRREALKAIERERAQE